MLDQIDEDQINKAVSSVYKLLTPSDGNDWEPAHDIHHFLALGVMDKIDDAFSDLFYILMGKKFSDDPTEIKYYLRQYKEVLVGLTINELIEKLSDDLFSFSKDWSLAKVKTLEWMWSNVKKKIFDYNRRYYLDRV